MAEYPLEVAVKLHVGDTVAYRTVDYRVDGVIDYVLGERTLRLVAMSVPTSSSAGTRVCFVEPVVVADRVLVLCEIERLDIGAPPPATIYHGGESYLLKLSGEAVVSIAGRVDGREPGPCKLWRFRAAGDQYLQIEEWPDGLRMLAGTAIHKGMLEVRPATPDP